MLEPQFGQGDPNTSEGDANLLQMASRAMASVIHQPVSCRSHRIVHQIHEKSISQREQTEQFETHFPIIDTHTLDGQLTFEGAERYFDLPASGIGKNDFPGLLLRLDHLIGQQIPGFSSLATSNQQGEWPVREVGMGDRKKEDRGHYMAMVNGIPHLAGLLSSFPARNFPCRLFDPFCVHQMIFFVPTLDETHIKPSEGSQPETAGISLIENMDRAASPALGHVA